jgi:SAM-dependent methyltransferase
MRPGALEPYERALTGRGELGLATSDGRRLGLDIARWLAPVDAADESVLERCAGPTLDVGCGPGRFVHARALTGQITLGVDIADAAVELTARQAVPVLLRSVFDRVPGEGRWQTVLLMDGNVGIGGDPIRLLRRLRRVLHPRGQLLVETAPQHDTDDVLSVRFCHPGVGTPSGPAFDWALVGRTALREHAASCGYRDGGSWSCAGRTFVRLVR